MSLGSLLNKAHEKVHEALRRPLESVDAVFDDDLWEILARLGLLSQLDEGRATCYLTGTSLTRDNLGGIIGTPDGPKLVSDSAVQSLHRSRPGIED